MSSNTLEQALDSLVDALQLAERDRALPIVHSLCVDFPAVKQFVFMEPEKMIEYLNGIIGKSFFPAVQKKVAGHEAVFIERLRDVQSRLREWENR